MLGLGRRRFDAGRQATDHGGLLEALEHYRTATRLAPDSARAQLALGETAEALGEFDEALSAYQAAARRSPSTRTWLRLGEMADRDGAGGPGDPVARASVRAMARARLARDQGWPGEAFAAYSRVLTMNPTDAHAHANVGWLFLKGDRQTEGVRELQVAVRLAPGLDRERRFLDGQFGRDARQGPTPFSVR